MITDGKKRYYLVVKSFSLLFKGITSNHVENFYCLNCFHLFILKISLKLIKMNAKIMIIVM